MQRLRALRFGRSWTSAAATALNTTLESLYLRSNGIGAEGATRLAECLQVNTALTSLDLYRNGIGVEGATQLAECLRVNTRLTGLYLGYHDFARENSDDTPDIAECQLAELLESLGCTLNEGGEAESDEGDFLKL